MGSLLRGGGGGGGGAVGRGADAVLETLFVPVD